MKHDELFKNSPESHLSKNHSLPLKLIFLLIPILVVPLSLHAIDFKEQLNPGLFLKYKHWNIKKKKLTGYTSIKYQIIEKDGNRYIVESSEDTKPSGIPYRRKDVWFDYRSGQLMLSWEQDLRSGLSIHDHFEGDEIHSYIVHKEEKKFFSVDMEADLVPFEVIALYLQKQLSDLLKDKKNHRFTLYLPLMAFELEKKHLPLTLSQIGVNTIKEKELTLDTPFGRVPAVQLLIKPTSFLVKQLLPNEKTEFRFTLAGESPYYLLRFKEGDTELILIELHQSKIN